MTVLSICQDAAVDLALVSPSTIVGSSAAESERLLRHLNRTIKELAARHDWQQLKREQTFTTTATEAQSSALPSDFLRFVPNSMFNRTRVRKVFGPMSPNEWQYYKARPTTSIREITYMRGGTLYMQPTPTAGHTIAYEYITSNIGTTSGGTALSAFADDTDIPYLDAELLTLGVVWKFRKAEGLDYAEEFREYELRRADLLKMDGGRRRLDMNQTHEDVDWNVSVEGNSIEDLTTI